MICSSVDFPHPEGPTIETNLPGAMSSETPPIASSSPWAAWNA
jgi:hypothetical protein